MGRADPKEGWGATVMVQVIDAASFGGVDAMRRQMDFIVDECHAAMPRDAAARVRLPGERALKLMREQRAQGVALHPTIMPALGAWAKKLGVAMPEAVGTGH
jgi:L-lactate dehydrogenase